MVAQRKQEISILYELFANAKSGELRYVILALWLFVIHCVTLTRCQVSKIFFIGHNMSDIVIVRIVVIALFLRWRPVAEIK